MAANNGADRPSFEKGIGGKKEIQKIKKRNSKNSKIQKKQEYIIFVTT
jgi:hypothetical protein